MAKPGQSLEPIDGTLPFCPDGLVGRTADEPAIVRWVARNIDVPEPDPKTCPDPFAWTLLRSCRLSGNFTAFFVEKLWAKLIPPRSQLEAAGPKAQEGKAVIELVDRILAHSQAATEASPPEVASPLPEPEPSVAAPVDQAPAEPARPSFRPARRKPRPESAFEAFDPKELEGE